MNHLLGDLRLSERFSLQHRCEDEVAVDLSKFLNNFQFFLLDLGQLLE